MNGWLCRPAGAVALVVALTVCAPVAHALTLSDASVFSSNADGGAYGGLTWNSIGDPLDVAGRWNLYFSSSSDVGNPVWLNGFNNSQTNLNFALAPGDHSFVLYADSAGAHGDHFTLSLYFGGNQASPGISAAVPVNSGIFGVAAANNGLGLLECFGPCNYIANAGALSFSDGSVIATLTAFSWFTSFSPSVDFVWPHHHGAGYSGSGRVDFVGFITLHVEAVAVPEPGSLALLSAGVLGLAAVRRRRAA